MAARKNKIYNNTIESIIGKLDKKESGCWEWTGGLSNKGYGMVRYLSKYQSVHRLLYFHFTGIPKNSLHCCHKCDNPKCCNPDHIFLGTHADNMKDAGDKGRKKGKGTGVRVTHCPKGHEYIEGSYYYNAKQNSRACKICKHQSAIKHRQKRKDEKI